MSSNMKLNIAEAYSDLIRKKDVDKITVKDVVTACGITRQTFYYHFEDLQDVLKFSVCKKGEDALKAALETETLEDAVLVFLKTIEENRTSALRLLNSKRHGGLSTLLIPFIRTWLEQVTRKKALNSGSFIDGISIKDGDFALQFYSYAIAGVFLEICMDENVDLEQTSVLMVKLLNRPFAKQL